MRPIIYLDNSATTKIHPEVVDAMKPFQEDLFGNAGSLHWLGRQSRTAIETARQQVGDLLSSTAEEIFFSPSATYSNNVAILGRARYAEENNLGRHIITTRIEHSSALLPAKHLESRGWDVTLLDVDNEGIISLDQLLAAIRPDTSMISIMWGNNEIGSLQPIKEIGTIASERGIFFHCDAVQVAGKLAIDVNDIHVDSLSISGHKMHAPKGIGALFIRKGVEVAPLMFGGGQEQGLFSGTEALTSIVGLGKAAEIARLHLATNQRKLKHYQRILLEKLLRYSGVKLTGPKDLNRRVPGHASVVVQDVDGSDLVLDADIRGVCVSSVSACSSGVHEISHVLSAIGVSRDFARGSLRVTAGIFNTAEECEHAAGILNDVISSYTFAVPANQQMTISA